MAKEVMTLKGFEWDSTHNVLSAASTNLDYEMPYSESIQSLSHPSRYGMPITVDAFIKIVDKYRQAVQDNPGNLKFFNFFKISKTSLFRVLAQEDVEKVAFFLCLPFEDSEVSVAIQGLDKNDMPVKMGTNNITSYINRASQKTDPLIEEKVTPSFTSSLLRRFNDFSEAEKFAFMRDINAFFKVMYEVLAEQ